MDLFTELIVTKPFQRRRQSNAGGKMTLLSNQLRKHGIVELQLKIMRLFVCARV